jgi:hypothetical protein
MPDTVVSALLSGLVVGLVSSAATLWAVVITQRAETKRLRLRLLGEEESRVREKRRDQLLDAISEMLKITDPESKVDYDRALSLIHRVSLLLSPYDPTEREVNGAVMGLMLSFREYFPLQGTPSSDEKDRVASRVFGAQGKVIDTAKAHLHRRPGDALAES